MSIHHYMVDYEDERGVVGFANDTEIRDLKEAKALARRTSKQAPWLSAAVIAYEENDNGTAFLPVGEIIFSEGRMVETTGCVEG